jgi:hypothetical protein
LSTVTSDRIAPLARQQVSLWVGALAVLAALVVGFWLGKPHSGDSGQPSLQSGVISLIDTEQGLVCIQPEPEPGQLQECYRAPGVQMKVGDSVRFSLEKVLLDPANPDHGTQQVIVYAESEDDLG